MILKFQHELYFFSLARCLIGKKYDMSLKGLPGLTAEAINKFIGVEDATEMGHTRGSPSGTRSTTKQTNRGQSPLEILERDAAMEDTMSVP